MIKKNTAAVFMLFMLIGALDGQAANWVKNEVDIPNKSVDSNYYDADTVKVSGKTLSWTEKFVLTDFGKKYYTKHLAEYQVCKSNIAKKGEVAYHQIDFEIKEGKFRTVAKRNYNKSNELLCNDGDMGTEFNKTWSEIGYQSPVYFRYSELVGKFNLGNI